MKVDGIYSLLSTLLFGLIVMTNLFSRGHQAKAVYIFAWLLFLEQVFFCTSCRTLA